LDGANISVKGSAQAWQRDCKYRAIDECHRGCEHAGSKNDAATRRRDFATQLARTRLSVYNAGAARIAERLRHGALHERPV
jgi:hypothetical protein